MKKLKCEMLEIDLRRQELNKAVLEADEEQNAINSQRKSSKSWLTNMITFKQEPVKISDDRLNKLLGECDDRIVELSNIFLNEKIDLIFRHTREIDELNRQIAQLSRRLAKQGLADQVVQDSTSHTQTDLSGLDLAKIEELAQVSLIIYCIMLRCPLIFTCLGN